MPGLLVDSSRDAVVGFTRDAPRTGKNPAVAAVTGRPSTDATMARSQFASRLGHPHRGYPLYVGVSRMIHWIGFSPAWTSLLMGFLGSLAALIFLIPLAREMFGARAAWIAPLLLFFHPTFIMAGA